MSLVEPSPPVCGALGCTADAEAIIDHPKHGQRAVCGGHATGYEVVRRVR